MRYDFKNSYSPIRYSYAEKSLQLLHLIASTLNIAGKTFPTLYQCFHTCKNVKQQNGVVFFLHVHVKKPDERQLPTPHYRKPCCM